MVVGERAEHANTQCAKHARCDIHHVGPMGWEEDGDGAVARQERRRSLVELDPPAQ